MGVLTTALTTALEPVKVLPSNSASIGSSSSGNFVTNLILQSQVFGNASWTKTRCTISASDTVVAPDGTTTADTLSEDNTATNNHFIQQNVSPIGVPVTLSCFVKPLNRSWVFLQLGTNGGYYNVTTGALGTFANGWTGSITKYSNGFYRCSLSTIPTSNTLLFAIANADVGVSFTGLNQTSLVLWGAQVETGWSANTYIPTTAATVTAEV